MIEIEAVPTRWQAAILGAVRNQGRCTIAALAVQLGVSDETVRRHVRPLVESGLLRREHGAVSSAEVAAEPPFFERMREAEAAKRAIAEKVFDLVEDGQSLMIDTGSTTAYVAAALARRRDLLVVTNSLEIARSMVGRRGHRVYMAGGELRADIAAAVGPEALAMIRQFRADLAVLSIGAVDPLHGFADYDLDEARIAQAMIAQSERVLVAADARKFAARAAARVCGFDEVDIVVCDSAPAEVRERIEADGASVFTTESLCLRASGGST